LLWRQAPEMQPFFLFSITVLRWVIISAHAVNNGWSPHKLAERGDNVYIHPNAKTGPGSVETIARQSVLTPE